METDILEKLSRPVIYELGYETCTCPKVRSGKISNPEQCECSRQKYLLHSQLS